MSSHYLGLQNAAVLQTRHFLLTESAVSDVIDAEAMGAVFGPAGLGKTFAVAEALAQHKLPVIRLSFETTPTMRLVADRLLHAFTGVPSKRTRFVITEVLIDLLAQRRRLVIIGEAQNLNRDCFEYLRHLHDDPNTHFGLIFDGGDGCWDVISREPMLHSRIYRPVSFTPLIESDILDLIPTYHPIYQNTDPDLLLEIDERIGHGRMRSWAAFTKTAADMCARNNTQQINAAITRSAIARFASH
jgi:DNA transposition AAA+ family ATPase